MSVTWAAPRALALFGGHRLPPGGALAQGLLTLRRHSVPAVVQVLQDALLVTAECIPRNGLGGAGHGVGEQHTHDESAHVLAGSDLLDTMLRSLIANGARRVDDVDWRLVEDESVGV